MRKILLGTAIIAGFAVFMNECSGYTRGAPTRVQNSQTVNANAGATSAQTTNANTSYNASVSQIYQTPQQVTPNTIYPKPTNQVSSITQVPAQQQVSGMLNNTMTNSQNLKNQNGTTTYNNNQVTQIATSGTEADWAVGTKPSGFTQSLREKNEWKQELDEVITNRINIDKDLEKNVEQTIKGFKNLRTEVNKLYSALEPEITKTNGREQLAYWARKLTLFDDDVKKFNSMDKIIGYISGKCRPTDFNREMDNLKHLAIIRLEEIKLSLHNTIWWIENDATLSKYRAQVNNIGNRLVALKHSAVGLCGQINAIIQANQELLSKTNDSVKNAADGLNEIKELLEKIQIMCDTVNDVIMGTLTNGQKPGLLQNVMRW